MSLKFSPVHNILSVGQITGEIRLYSYSETEMKEHVVLSHHEDSVRAIDYNPAGNILYACSTDHSYSVISAGRLEGRLENAHKEAINSILHLEDGHVIATGDDDGVMKVWDLRQAHKGKKSCVIEFREHEGTISEMAYREDCKMLLSASNDGMLGVFDLRKPILYAMSDNFYEDQSAVLLCKNGKKVVTASSEGVLNLFSWDWFGDCNDRITGHPNAIHCMVKYDEDTIITGGEDGLLRAVSILPNRIIAILSDTMDQDDGFHI
jgi:WD repeat-containing protein 55